MPLPISAESSRIPLRVSNGKAYVWDIDDIAILRSKHNVCGILTGTLPHLSQQNVFLGVPLLLMPEEAVLLVEKELAALVDDRRAHLPPTQHQLLRWSNQVKESAKSQMAFSGAKEAQESQAHGRAMSEAAIKKRKEREEKRAREFAMKTVPADGSSELFDHSPAIPQTHEIPSVKRDSSSSSSPAYAVTVPASSSAYEWYDSGACSYATIEAAKAAGIWRYPSTLSERARCGVFADLWEQGYFMGDGIKFGGEYLVYPGDPLRYHSHFVASVLESPTHKLTPMEIVAHGRLGTATKKAHLLCGWDDEKREVSYFSIEWAGFGLSQMRNHSEGIKPIVYQQLLESEN